MVTWLHGRLHGGPSAIPPACSPLLALALCMLRNARCAAFLCLPVYLLGCTSPVAFVWWCAVEFALMVFVMCKSYAAPAASVNTLCATALRMTVLCITALRITKLCITTLCITTLPLPCVCMCLCARVAHPPRRTRARWAGARPRASPPSGSACWSC